MEIIVLYSLGYLLMSDFVRKIFFTYTLLRCIIPVIHFYVTLNGVNIHSPVIPGYIYVRNPAINMVPSDVIFSY